LKKKNFQKFIELKTIIAMINSSKVKTHTSITFNKKFVASTVTTQKGSETGHQHRIHGKWKTSNIYLNKNMHITAVCDDGSHVFTTISIPKLFERNC
jgi:hypothetical protein